MREAAISLIALVVPFAAAIGAPRLKDAVKIESPIVGTWREVLQDDIKKMRNPEILTFSSDGTRSTKRVVSGKDQNTYGTFRIVENAEPSKIDWVFEPKSAEFKPGYLLGIFKVEGDKLTLCLYATYSPEEFERPSEFKNEPLSYLLTVYERVKPR